MDNCPFKASASSSKQRSQVQPLVQPLPWVLRFPMVFVGPHLPPFSGRVWFAVVLDLFRRKVFGWSMCNSLATELITDAMHQTIQWGRPYAGTQLRQSDRGGQ
jgi:transposase InsO family protein